MAFCLLSASRHCMSIYDYPLTFHEISKLKMQRELDVTSFNPDSYLPVPFISDLVSPLVTSLVALVLAANHRTHRTSTRKRSLNIASDVGGLYQGRNSSWQPPDGWRFRSRTNIAGDGNRLLSALLDSLPKIPSLLRLFSSFFSCLFSTFTPFCFNILSQPSFIHFSKVCFALS